MEIRLAKQEESSEEYLGTMWKIRLIAVYQRFSEKVMSS